MPSRRRGGMTPFEVTLRHELDTEYNRFINAWLFRWHSIGEGEVDLEDFFGGRFHLGGVAFHGGVQRSFWRSVEKYLVDKAHGIFAQWDGATKGYPEKSRRSSLEGIGHELRDFTRRIMERAVTTDRALRGNGNPQSVEKYNATGHHSHVNAEIFRLVAAHGTLIEKSRDLPLRLRERIENYLANHKGIIGLIGLLVAIFLGGAKLFLG